MASIYYNMIKRDAPASTDEVVALLWNPQRTWGDHPEETVYHGIFTSTYLSNLGPRGVATPHYAVFKGMKDYFPKGTTLYQATTDNSMIQVLANATKTMLINRYNAQKTVSLNGTTLTLAPYEVLFITTPSSGTPIKVDDTDASIRYYGTWGSSTGAPYYNSTQHYVNESSAKYDSASMSFTGKSVSWVYRKGTDRGRTDVYIDGQWDAQIDVYSNPTATNPEVLYTKSWAASGKHFIRIVPLFNHNSSSTNYLSGLDYFEYTP
jgi:hypothetical protein